MFLVSRPFIFVLERPDLGRTSDDPHAAEIDVTGLAHIWKSEITQCRDNVVVRVVVMPLEARCVDKDGGIGKSVVIVDYVGEIHHCFASLIFRYGKEGQGIVDDVDFGVPLREVPVHPRGILVARARHHDLCFAMDGWGRVNDIVTSGINDFLRFNIVASKLAEIQKRDKKDGYQDEGGTISRSNACQHLKIARMEAQGRYKLGITIEVICGRSE